MFFIGPLFLLVWIERATAQTKRPRRADLDTNMVGARDDRAANGKTMT
jgi:hypothetical protein